VTVRPRCPAYAQCMAYSCAGYTQNNGAVSIVNTIETAPFFCVFPVFKLYVTSTCFIYNLLNGIRLNFVFFISGFLRNVDEICGLLGNYTASCGNYLPTFRDNVSKNEAA
jgi:hypothetical protein